MFLDAFFASSRLPGRLSFFGSVFVFCLPVCITLHVEVRLHVVLRGAARGSKLCGDGHKTLSFVI
jgi:hypothetical protein